MPARSLECRQAMATLMVGDTGDAAAVGRARQHARICPNCSELVDASTTSDDVLERALNDRLGPPLWLRVALVVVATIQIALALPWLLGYAPYGTFGEATKSHLTRDGALGLIVGSVGLLVALRPRFVLAGLVTTVIAAAAGLLTGLIDHHDHEVATSFEIIHFLVLGILVLLVLIFGTRSKVKLNAPNRPQRLRNVT